MHASEPEKKQKVETKNEEQRKPTLASEIDFSTFSFFSFACPLLFVLSSSHSLSLHELLH